MRLSVMLCKWPRSRPNGYIWSGKHQMVRNVKDGHITTMQKQIEMVTTIIFGTSQLYCTPLGVFRRRTMPMSV